MPELAPDTVTLKVKESVEIDEGIFEIEVVTARLLLVKKIEVKKRIE